MSEKLSRRSLELLTLERVAHLATADQYARPHIVPIVFVYEDPFVFTPIDAKPKSVEDWRDLRRVLNIETNGHASVIVDVYNENWAKLAWVRMDGVADILTKGEDHRYALGLIAAIAAYGFYTSQGTRPIFRDSLSEPSARAG